MDLILENELFDLNRAYRATADAGERTRIAREMRRVESILKTIDVR
jgi:hypothetical protein